MRLIGAAGAEQQTTFREDIDQSEIRSGPKRMIEGHDYHGHTDLDLLRRLCDRGGKNLGRSDHAVAREQVFGNPDRVEAQRLSQLELLEIGLEILRYPAEVGYLAQAKCSPLHHFSPGGNVLIDGRPGQAAV